MYYYACGGANLVRGKIFSFEFLEDEILNNIANGSQTLMAIYYERKNQPSLSSCCCSSLKYNPNK